MSKASVLLATTPPTFPPKKCFKTEATDVTICSKNQTRKQIVLQEYDHFHQHINEQPQKKSKHRIKKFRCSKNSSHQSPTSKRPKELGEDILKGLS